MDLFPQEKWSALHWTALRREQISQQDLHLMMLVMAHLSSIGEHSCDEQHHGVSRPHGISHPVDSVQFLSAILACLAEMALFLLYLLFSRDSDQQHLCCNTELVAACAIQACFSTAQCLGLAEVQANLPSSVKDFSSSC